MSSAESPASSSAASEAHAPSSAEPIPGWTKRLSLMPVRGTIHSSFVSMMRPIISFVTTWGGTYIPEPRITVVRSFFAGGVRFFTRPSLAEIPASTRGQGLGRGGIGQSRWPSQRARMASLAELNAEMIEPPVFPAVRSPTRKSPGIEVS